MINRLKIYFLKQIICLTNFDQDQVKNQHKERAIAFLSSELGVCTKEEALDRIFFISAKEALQIRLQEAKGQPPNIHTEDYFNRYLEYQQFEKKLEHCLSSTAVRTKFASHTSRGKDIVSREGNMIGQVRILGSHWLIIANPGL